MIPTITRTTTNVDRIVWNRRSIALWNGGRHQRLYTNRNVYTTPLSLSSSCVHVSDYRKQKELPIQKTLGNIHTYNRRLVNVSVLYRNFFSTSVANDQWSQSPPSQSSISSAINTEEKEPVELCIEEKLSAADTASEDPSLNVDPTIRQKLRAQYDKKKQAYRENLVELRESAKDHYREYREHPTQTAKKDAKSISSMIREYGPVFIGTYIACYFTTLGLLFAGVQSGVLDPVVLFHWLGQTAADTAASTATSAATGSITEAEATAAAATSTVQLVVDFLGSHDFTKPYAPYIEKNPAVANLAVAWIAVKFTEPVRLAASVTLTPRVARYLGHKPASKDEGKDE